MTPKVSIVMPTRNREHFLPQAIQSCLNQSLKDFELIVVDDASEDKTEAVVRSMADVRIIYVKQPFQQGSVACLNRGFKIARGQYLTWTSDDDYYSSNEALATLTAVLDSEADVGFVYSNYDMVNEEGCFLNEARVDDPATLDRDNYVGHCFLYRREVYEKVGDYTAVYFLAEEYEYWLRVREYFLMKRISQRLYCHRLHSTSLTMTHKREQVLDMVALARKRFIPSWKQHFFLAEQHYHGRRRCKAVGNSLWSLFLNPFNPEGWRIFFLVVLPASLVEYVRNIRLRIKKNN